MCGRFTLTKPADEIADYFELHDLPEWQPRYNIAPTQPAPTIRFDHVSKQRVFEGRHWGLIPSWSRDEKFAARLINARAETASEKPSFRAAMKRQRCLIVTDGFYEWQASATKGQRKQPYYIQMQAGNLFAMAGLWARWQRADGQVIQSCTVLTTSPNVLMNPIHDRMPVILSSDDYDRWLDPTMTDQKACATLLSPYSADTMKAVAVSTKVNPPSYDAADCVQPLTSHDEHG